MSRWFVKVDISSRSVQIISTYLRAIDYYHELNAMYTEKGAALYGRELSWGS